MKQELKIYKALSVSQIDQKNAMYCIKGVNDSEFTIVITDISGVPIYQKDNTGGAGVNSVTGTGVTGTSTNPIVNIATFLSNELGNLISISTDDNKLFVEPITSPNNSIEVSGTQLELSTALLNLINSAVQPEDLADVAISGDYNDLDNKPETPLFVDNITELRNTNGVDLSTVTLLGYYQKGDKAPLNYIYKIGSFIDDNGSVIKPIGDLLGAWIAVFKGDISVKDFGANENLNNNLQFIQRTIDYCLNNTINELSLSNKTYNISGILSIPRDIDALENSQKFYIKNGGLKQFGNTAIIRGNLTDNISSQLVTFQNVEFSSNSSISTVLYKNTMLRMFFESCSFVQIKFCDTIEYLQSIYFNDCNFRYWSGDFFLAKNGCYDIHFKGGLAEHGENFINLNPETNGFTKTERINGLFVSDMCIEGLEGVGILYQDCNSLSIQDSYFEANKGGDVLNSSDDSQNTNYNININNNIHLLGGAEPIPNHNGEYYHVIFNSTQGGTCQGNFSTGNFSYMKSEYFTCDFRGNYAQSGSITNKENSIGNIKTYYGNNLSPETLNYDTIILKGAVVYIRDFNPAVSNLFGWVCTQSGDYITAVWKELKSYTQEIDDNVIHKTGNEIKQGTLTTTGLGASKDDSGVLSSHLVLNGKTGANVNKSMYAGVNTTTNKVMIQGLWDGVDVMPLQLQPLGGGIEIADGVNSNNPVSLGQLNTKFNTPTGNNTQYLDGAGTPTIFPTIPSGVTNLTYTPTPTNGTVISDTGTDATITAVDYTNAGLQTPKEKQLEYNNASTGLISFSGLSVNTDTTKFNVGAIKGWFIDNTTTPETPTKIYVDFPQSLANTVTNIATQNVTYVAIDSLGVLHQSSIPFEPEQQRDWIPLGVIVHSNRTIINAVNNQPVVALSPNNQLSDLMESIGFFNISGNIFFPNGTNLSINKSAGHVFKQGSNFINNNKDPHALPLSALTAPSNIRYRLQNGTESADTNVVAPNFWDDGGVLTAMTGTRWSIQRIYVFQSNLVRIQYGQATYATKADAIEAISTESFVVEQNILENGLFRGLLIVRRNTTDLTDTTRALFIEASKFGSVTGLGSLSTSSLQQAYNNSLTPEITTDTTLGAVTIKRGSTSDTDKVFETQNGAGAVTASIDGNGQILGTNLSGTNTGDETTLGIQTKRPLKTVNGNSLEGIGNLTIPIPTLTETEIDFGIKPLNNKTFTITDGTVNNTNKIMIAPSPNSATGQTGNDWEIDSATFSAKANTGNITLYVNTPFSMNGKRKIYYQILN